MGSTKNLDLFFRRRELGLTQRPVAERLGCSVSALSKFENDERPDLPGGKGREDYEAVLRELAAELAAAARLASLGVA